MPRLTDPNSGVVVSVSDETAARLGGRWKPVETKKAPAKKAAAKPAAKKGEG